MSPTRDLLRRLIAWRWRVGAFLFVIGFPTTTPGQETSVFERLEIVGYPCDLGRDFDAFRSTRLEAFGKVAAATRGLPRPLPGEDTLSIRLQSAETNESTAGDNSSLAQVAQNPIAHLAAIPLQSNWDQGFGPFGRTRYVGLLQPVVPWKLSEEWSLITRPIVPFLNVPIGPGRHADGLGDITAQFYFTPKPKGKLIWGIGPNVMFPTATNRFTGFGEWGLGLDAVALISDGPIVAGLLYSQIWGFGNQTDPFLLQPFFNYNFKDGWFFAASGELNADWEFDESKRYAFPLGAGVGRTFPLGGQPLTILTRFAPYVIQPEGGADWQFRLLVSLLFPK